MITVMMMSQRGWSSQYFSPIAGVFALLYGFTTAEYPPYNAESTNKIFSTSVNNSSFTPVYFRPQFQLRAGAVRNPAGSSP